MKRAGITGITVEDGSYLAELWLAKDYEVHGLVRLRSLESPSRLIICSTPMTCMPDGRGRTETQREPGEKCHPAHRLPPSGCYDHPPTPSHLIILSAVERPLHRTCDPLQSRRPGRGAGFYQSHRSLETLDVCCICRHALPSEARRRLGDVAQPERRRTASWGLAQAIRMFTRPIYPG